MIDRILVADDEFLIRQLMEETASRHGVETVTAGSGEEAMKLLQEGEFQMAFVDLKMGRASGMDVLKFCAENRPGVLFVIMTAYGTLETATEAMRVGAFDFVIKPFTPDQMDIMLEKGRLWLELNERERYFRREIEAPGGRKIKAVGDCPRMTEIYRLVERVAPTRATVLVTGESGTGKELIASEIHKLSEKGGPARPYIRMNCAAVPESLLESELFGHEKGAFTGADERRVGRFELANGGTLLLDEIGEISKNMQAKLLRVLQESEFERVGGSKTIKVDVRVVATTNRNLKEEVAKGEFREDLYYRLNVFPIHLPPLRERGDDCVKIAEYFFGVQEKRLGRKLGLSDGAKKWIKANSWPGNIRELENTVERVAILEDGPVIGEDAFQSGSFAQPGAKASAEPETFNMAVIERETIKNALKRTSGNRTKAADLLGFSVRTLRNKLNEYREAGLLDEEFLGLVSDEQPQV